MRLTDPKVARLKAAKELGLDGPPKTPEEKMRVMAVQKRFQTEENLANGVLCERVMMFAREADAYAYWE